MSINEQIKTMDEALQMCEAKLHTEYDERTISLAKAGIVSMIHTIGINISMDGHKDIHPGKVLCVVFELLKTLDTASDHVAAMPHKKN
jgi:hypothetical protein